MRKNQYLPPQEMGKGTLGQRATLQLSSGVSCVTHPCLFGESNSGTRIQIRPGACARCSPGRDHWAPTQQHHVLLLSQSSWTGSKDWSLRKPFPPRSTVPDGRVSTNTLWLRLCCSFNDSSLKHCLFIDFNSPLQMLGDVVVLVHSQMWAAIITVTF